MSSELERYERPRVEAMDEILGKPLKVLDDGFVRVVDYMGSDESVVQAARVSYGKGTKRISEDRGLIRYLMRHRHTTPFEMCEIKFHVRVPMDCWRQWIRHRMANVNEYSTRYSIAIDAAQKTPPDAWRLQAPGNRQGSAGFVDEEAGAEFSRKEEELQKHSRDHYQNLLDAGVAREQARKDLPLSTYTEAYWKSDLHNLLNFVDLRMDDHAQYEIRSYARLIGEIVSRWCPLVWAAFLDYRVNALSLTKLEFEIIKKIASGERDSATNLAIEFGLLPADLTKIKKNRERAELEEKLKRLNLAVPWKEFIDRIRQKKEASAV
jgi:thymidylate synthase (FAD)